MEPLGDLRRDGAFDGQAAPSFTLFGERSAAPHVPTEIMPAVASAPDQPTEIMAAAPTARGGRATRGRSTSGSGGGRSDNVLAQRFPRRLSLAVLGAALLVLVLAFGVAELALRADWAEGVLAVSIAALTLAALAAVGWSLRLGFGRTAVSTLIFALALVVVLAGIGAAGIQSLTGLHALQAKQFEQSKQFAAAVNEYALYGEQPPDGTDLARVYDEWAEQLLAQHAYLDAAERLTLVTLRYQQTGVNFDRAQADLVQTYGAWLTSGAKGIPFGDAISAFSAERASKTCNAACKAQTITYEAQARFEYGTQLTDLLVLPDAITQFTTIESQFASSPYAAKAHAAAAVDYYALGQQQIAASSCPAAVATYQTLLASYADTPQGATAKVDFAAPQNVVGTLSGYPTDPAPVMYLSHYADPGSFYYSKDFAANVDPTSGSFTFAGVAQGDYFITSERSTSSGPTYGPYYDNTTGKLLVIHVGPLCPVQLGTAKY